jgi:glucose/arabinose dehydrogenase
VGSASDNCQNYKTLCPEASTQGLLRIYDLKTLKWEVFAWGLRNSMALAVHKSGTILQGENSRDAINAADPKLSDERYPADELNVVQKSLNYGWPYCYDNQKNAPEFPAYNCKNTQAPVVLLPAHVAPLGMDYWGSWLVVGYHGYRPRGHRLVAFDVDQKGIPTGKFTELIKNWKLPNGRSGAPVDVKGADGKIYITDDRNKMLLVLQKLP